MTYQFDDFALEVDRGTLTCAGADLQLRPKAYAVLLYLVEHHGRLVSRGDLLESVWGDTIVTDGAVTQCLIDVRKVLGDSDQSKIRTVPKRGYVFEVPVRTTRESNRDSEATERTGSMISWRPVLGVALGLLIVGLTFLQLRGPSNEDLPGTVAIDRTRSAPSIAVLPFVDMSPNQDQEYFADGISDEVLSLMTRVRGLRVIARTSSFAFKNEKMSIADIAASLDVSHVLQGSVRKSNDRIRVSAQLIDASSSEQIWSESFDREIDEVFQVQDQISAAVVERLELSFSEQLSPSRRSVPEARNLFLRAVHTMDQGKGANTYRAEVLLAEAVELDPNSAPAWRELARLRWRKLGIGPSPHEDVEAVRDALNRSYTIDPDDPATLAYLAASVGDFDGDIQRAARFYERAIALNPADEHVLRTGLIFLTNYGTEDDAIALGEYGILHNPICFLCAKNLAFAYLRGQRFAEAETLSRSIVALHGRGHWLVGQALLIQGRPQEALEWFAKERNEGLQITGKAMALTDLSRHVEAEEIVATFAESAIFSAPKGFYVWAYAWTGRIDAAFEAYERIIDRNQKYGGKDIVRQQPWEMAHIASSPFMAPLHEDSRWESIAARLKISDEHQSRLNFKLALPDD